MPDYKKALYNATHSVPLSDEQESDINNVFSPNLDERINYSVPGFNFTQSDFEDLIDNFSSFNDILIILNQTISNMDKFCLKIYRMPYKETYTYLAKKSSSTWKKAFSKLAKDGNQTALKIVADKFLQSDEQSKKNDLKIVICSDLPIDDVSINNESINNGPIDDGSGDKED
jgi:hypothetical protein